MPSNELPNGRICRYVNFILPIFQITNAPSHAAPAEIANPRDMARYRPAYLWPIRRKPKTRNQWYDVLRSRERSIVAACWLPTRNSRC